MIEVLTGRRTFDADALREITKLAIKDSETVLKNYREKYESGSLGRYFENTGDPEPLVAIRPNDIDSEVWAYMTQEEKDRFAIGKK